MHMPTRVVMREGPSMEQSPQNFNIQEVSFVGVGGYYTGGGESLNSP